MIKPIDGMDVNKVSFFGEVIHNLRREESAMKASFLILMNKLRMDYKAAAPNRLTRSESNFSRD